MIRASLLAVLLLPFAHPARADVAPSWSRRKVLPTPPCAAQIVPKEKKTTLTFPGGKTIKLDLVDTPSTREIGLMCVTKMPRTYGMMFVFPQDMQLSFWMKNTLVPLDIIWIGADKKITVIHEKLRGVIP